MPSCFFAVPPRPLNFLDAQDLGCGVRIEYLVDGRVALQGTLLARAEPMLRRIFCFVPSVTPVGAASTSACTADFLAPRWVSSWPLNLTERIFVAKVIKHRLPALAANEDQLVAIPDSKTTKLIGTLHILLFSSYFIKLFF